MAGGEETSLLDAGSRPGFARNQRARNFCCGRCAPRFREARRFRCRRRRSGRAVHASIFGEGPMSEAVDQARLEALVAELRKIPPFTDQQQADLEWFVSQAQERRVEVGGVIVKEGGPADTMLVILEGEFRARRENGPPDGPVFTARAGDVTGVLPFSRMKTVGVTGRAVLPTRSLAFPAAKFPELFQRMPELSQRLVGLLTDRVRYVTREEQQRGKLAALGKLSAGLAHEVNNPVSAPRRSAAALRDCLQRLRVVRRSSTLRPEDCGLLAKLEEQIRAELKTPEYKYEISH